jgi:hypothetical protein
MSTDPSDNPSFSLPLSRAAFGAALRLGHGRALMHVRAHGAAGVDELILDACRHDHTHDKQVDEERDPWLVELIDAAADCPDLADRVIAELAQRSETVRRTAQECWNDAQLCRVVAELARRGRDDARAALYGAFGRRDYARSKPSAAQFGAAVAALVGDEAIIDLDGADGLLFVARRIGQWMEADATIDGGLNPIHHFDADHSEGDALRVLKAAATHDPHIARYVDRMTLVSATGDGSQATPDAGSEFERDGAEDCAPWRTRMRDITAAQILDDIDHRLTSRARFASWGRHARTDQLEVIAERLFEAVEPERVLRLLSVFQLRAMPVFDARLIALADHGDREVRRIAYCALANHADDAVRALALARIRQSRASEGELKLFRKNYQAVDWRVIAAHLVIPDDIEALHAIDGDLLDVFEANATDEAVEPMRAIYERTPCMNCRRRAVELLIRIGRLPEWMARECASDASETIRRAVAGEAR